MPITSVGEISLSSLDITTSYQEPDATKLGCVTRQKRSIRGSATTTTKESRALYRQALEPVQRTEQENSYRLSPDGVFRCDKTRQEIRDLIGQRLAGLAYEEHAAVELTRQLSDDIKEAVKRATSSGRYKIVTFVTVGQKKLSTITSASQCVWNDSFDRRLEIRVDNGDVFVVALVFVLYVE